jgi:hypothetical protein
VTRFIYPEERHLVSRLEGTLLYSIHCVRFERFYHFIDGNRILNRGCNSVYSIPVAFGAV